MLASAGWKPSRTCIDADLPRWRMRRCSPSPLPSASPSGLRCEVIRKLRPERMRSATARAASGRFVAMILLDLLQQRFDAAGARRCFVVAKVELGSDAEVDPLPQEVTDASALGVQVAGDLQRLLLIEA